VCATKCKSYTISKWLVSRAYRLVKANAGAAGVDNETIALFEKDLENNLYKIWNRMSSNFAGASITHLCGVRTETCPPGMKTGDPISPPGGYVGGGMQPLTDIAIDPAGNVWVADNWRRPQSCFAPYASEAHSTLCGGNGLTVFYGMAKPVRAPQIGGRHAPLINRVAMVFAEDLGFQTVLNNYDKKLEL
jgi:hypothetical protein